MVFLLISFKAIWLFLEKTGICLAEVGMDRSLSAYLLGESQLQANLVDVVVFREVAESLDRYHVSLHDLLEVGCRLPPRVPFLPVFPIGHFWRRGNFNVLV